MVRNALFVLGDILLYVLVFAILVVTQYFIFIYPLMHYVLKNEQIEPIDLSFYIPLYFILLSASILSILITNYIFKRSWNVNGFNDHRLFQNLGKGIVLGFLMLTIGYVILLITKSISIIAFDVNLGLIIGFMIFFFIQSFFEEVVFRSYLIPAVSSRLGWLVGIIISSVLFSLVHIANSNVNVIGMLNIFCAGLLFGVIYVLYRSVWICTGLHFIWNYFQGTILGFEVSGIDIYSLIDLKRNGLDWITGGMFGFEGSIIASLIIVMVIGFLFYKNRYFEYYLRNNIQA